MWKPCNGERLSADYTLHMEAETLKEFKYNIYHSRKTQWSFRTRGPSVCYSLMYCRASTAVGILRLLSNLWWGFIKQTSTFACNYKRVAFWVNPSAAAQVRQLSAAAAAGGNLLLFWWRTAQAGSAGVRARQAAGLALSRRHLLSLDDRGARAGGEFWLNGAAAHPEALQHLEDLWDQTSTPVGTTQPLNGTRNVNKRPWYAVLPVCSKVSMAVHVNRGHPEQLR